MQLGSGHANQRANYRANYRADCRANCRALLTLPRPVLLSQGLVDERSLSSSWYLLTDDEDEAKENIRGMADGHFCIARNASDRSLTLFYTLHGVVLSRLLEERNGKVRPRCVSERWRARGPQHCEPSASCGRQARHPRVADCGLSQ